MKKPIRGQHGNWVWKIHIDTPHDPYESFENDSKDWDEDDWSENSDTELDHSFSIVAYIRLMGDGRTNNPQRKRKQYVYERTYDDTGEFQDQFWMVPDQGGVNEYYRMTDDNTFKPSQGVDDMRQDQSYNFISNFGKILDEISVDNELKLMNSYKDKNKDWKYSR